MRVIILMVISYLLGSIPNALWIGKVFCGIDVREHGSKNTGSTNAARVLGPKWGLLTLVLDILKGFVPTLIAVSLKMDFFQNLTNIKNIDFPHIKLDYDTMIQKNTKKPRELSLTWFISYSIRRISYYSFLLGSFDVLGFQHLVPLVLTLIQ